MRIHAGGDLPTLQGISEYSSTEDVLEKFGEPSEIGTSEDELVRRWDYPTYNVRFGFRMNKVTSISVYEGATDELSRPSGWDLLWPPTGAAEDWLTASRQVFLASILVFLMIVFWKFALKVERDFDRRTDAWCSLQEKLKSNAGYSERAEEEKILDSASPHLPNLVALLAIGLLLSILYWFGEVGRTAWKLGRFLLGML